MDNAWETETLDDAGQKAFFAAATEKQAAMEEGRAATRSLFFWFGIGGIAFGVLGMATGFVTVAKMPKVEPPQYTLVDKATGAIVRAVGDKDAPLLYGETTHRRAIRDVITACEGYIPQTWAKTDFHACMIQLAPDEQKRRDKDIGNGGPRFPPKVFGPTGWAMPTDFPDSGFVNRDPANTDPHQTYRYQVRYERTEVVNGIETHPMYTAEIAFSFHPELKIAPADALINQAGTQVVSFSTVKDRTP